MMNFTIPTYIIFKLIIKYVRLFRYFKFFTFLSSSAVKHFSQIKIFIINFFKRFWPKFFIHPLLTILFMYFLHIKLWIIIIFELLLTFAKLLIIFNILGTFIIVAYFFVQKLLLNLISRLLSIFKTVNAIFDKSTQHYRFFFSVLISYQNLTLVYSILIPLVNIRRLYIPDLHFLTFLQLRIVFPIATFIWNLSLIF